jgi:tRNA 2-selenouridine synthase
VSYGTYFFLKGVFYFMAFPFSSTFIVLCGKTGSGKSLLLEQLELSGYPSINLEKIASHRGSVFGGLLLSPQPSQRSFENELEKAFLRYASSEYIFIEQKPPSLGKRKIPGWMYSRMDEGILIQLEVDKKTRINNILAEYESAGKKNFLDALHKLNERLPATELQKSETYLHSENYEAFIESMLDYYDQASNYQLYKKANIIVPVRSTVPVHIMQQFLQSLQQAGIIIPNGISF